MHMDGRVHHGLKMVFALCQAYCLVMRKKQRGLYVNEWPMNDLQEMFRFYAHRTQVMTPNSRPLHG